MNPVCLFAFPIEVLLFHVFFLYLITVVLKERKIGCLFHDKLLSNILFVSFPPFQYLFSGIVPACCLMFASPQAPTGPLPPAATDERTRVATTSTRIQTAAPFLRTFLGLFGLSSLRLIAEPSTLLTSRIIR